MLTFKEFLKEEPTFTQIIQHLGKKTGLEHAYFRNTQTKQNSPIIVGNKDFVDANALHGKSFRPSPEDPKEFEKNQWFNRMHQPEHIMMHNHPSDTALSGSDTYQLLTNPRLKSVHAVTPSGSMYAAKLTNIGKKLMMHPHGPLETQLRNSARSLYRSVDGDPKQGLLAQFRNTNEGNHLEGHILNTAMHKAGVIHYKHFMRGDDVHMTSKHQNLIDNLSDQIANNFKSTISKYTEKPKKTKFI